MEQNKNPKCPHCGGDSIKYAYVYTLGYGKEQKYRCNSCYHIFIPRVYKQKLEGGRKIVEGRL